MKRTLTLSAGTCLALVAVCLVTYQASGQSITFDFEDGTDQGFGTGFGNDASASFPIVNIGGSLRMELLDTASFQQAGREGGGGPFLDAMNAAALNPAGYLLSYDWYIDTSLSPGNYGNFLQVGTYINSGAGGYIQDFPAIKDVEFNGTQLASGQVFSGTVSETFAAKFGDPLPAAFIGQTFMRMGLIMNGDGTQAKIYFDNITITPVPEPTALSLVGVGSAALLAFRRRKI